jgi:signal transduction histidine kinase
MKKAYGIISMVLQFFTPLQEDIELHRKELVLNVILGLCLSFSFGLLILLIASKTLNQSGISVFDFIFFTSPFLVAYICSRKGWINTSSIICISTFSFGTWYAIHTWGFTLPAALLSLVLTTTITGVLISSRAGFIYAFFATIFLSLDLYIMHSHGLGPDLSWQQTSIDWNDMIELSVFLLFVSGLTWLSNRQTELSLHRARNSEALLMIERDQLEVRVEERTKELEQARIEQISEVYNFIEFGKLSAGLIHDIMSPLSALCIELEQTKGKDLPHTALHETLQHVTSASHRIQQIIGASRKQIKVTLEKESISLREISQDIYTLHKHQLLKHGIDWHNEVDPSTILYTYPTLLSHVITNLVSNAIDACISKIEALALETTAAKENSVRQVYTPRIHVSSYIAGQELCIQVKDNGIGIPAQFADKVFQPFFSTKNGKGCGYGLSVSKHIIEKYFEGNLIHTVQDNETVFTITVPTIDI